MLKYQRVRHVMSYNKLDVIKFEVNVSGLIRFREKLKRVWELKSKPFAHAAFVSNIYARKCELTMMRWDI